MDLYRQQQQLQYGICDEIREIKEELAGTILIKRRNLDIIAVVIATTLTTLVSVVITVPTLEALLYRAGTFFGRADKIQVFDWILIMLTLTTLGSYCTGRIFLFLANGFADLAHRVFGNSHTGWYFNKGSELAAAPNISTDKSNASTSARVDDQDVPFYGYFNTVTGKYPCLICKLEWRFFHKPDFVVGLVAVSTLLAFYAVIFFCL